VRWFVFHARVGIALPLPLQMLLPVSVILLPAALTEISGHGVDTPWYLLLALTSGNSGRQASAKQARL
jgi:hypothetical protein